MAHLTVNVLFVEAAAVVTVGFIVRLIYDSWKVAVATRTASAARKVASYAADARLHRHKYRGGV
jgi:hypothetical protein